MIELCLLEDVCSINFKENTFKKDPKQFFNKNMKDKYSQNFISVLEDMVKVDPK